MPLPKVKESQGVRLTRMENTDVLERDSCQLLWRVCIEHGKRQLPEAEKVQGARVMFDRTSPDMHYQESDRH